MTKTNNSKEQEAKEKCHLSAYDLLKTTASWLQNPNNEIFSLLEYDDDSINIAAKGCVLAGEILKKAALDIQLMSGIEDTNKYKKDVIDAMTSLQSLANELDLSGDEKMMKKASVLDEILITFADNIQEQENFKKAYQDQINKIKTNAKSAQNGLKSSASDNEKSKSKTEEYRPLQAPLSTRYCPDHPGESLVRIRDGLAYCPLDNKQYDFENGYTTEKGQKIPGTSISHQTIDSGDIQVNMMFKDNK